MFREFTVRAVLNGFIVTIGCQTVVFESRENLIDAIVEYTSNPSKTEDEWLRKSCNATHTANYPVATESCRDNDVRAALANPAAYPIAGQPGEWIPIPPPPNRVSNGPHR